MIVAFIITFLLLVEVLQLLAKLNFQPQWLQRGEEKAWREVHRVFLVESISLTTHCENCWVWGLFLTDRPMSLELMEVSVTWKPALLLRVHFMLCSGSTGTGNIRAGGDARPEERNGHGWISVHHLAPVHALLLLITAHLSDTTGGSQWDEFGACQTAGNAGVN